MSDKKGKKEDKSSAAAVVKAAANAVEMLEVKPLLRPQLIVVNTLFRSAGLQIDLASTAIVYEMIRLYLKQGEDVSIRDISAVVNRVMSEPELNPPPPQQAQGPQR